MVYKVKYFYYSFHNFFEDWFLIFCLVGRCMFQCGTDYSEESHLVKNEKLYYYATF